MTPSHPPIPVAVVGPLFAGSEYGLAADLAAARALGLEAHPVSTAIVAASRGRVSDVVEVPVDTVRAQLDHLRDTLDLRGIKVGALVRGRAATEVLRVVERLDLPVVLDVVVAGPNGETLLDNNGIDVLRASLDRFALVTAGRADAELLSGGEIRSLDDAQVAVQRLARLGARRVIVRCGRLPARFFEADDPGGDGEAAPFDCDLYYDGEEFALFEAPHLDGAPVEGAASALALAALAGLIEGRNPTDALQFAKRFVTESIRHARPSSGGRRLAFDWQRTV
jgi:hydroxymethylpyrimidine kinase/phosphomethylpyrimidine kinase